MLNITKHNVLNENNEVVSVLIDYHDFLHIEETLENFGLVKLIDEAKKDGYLAKADAYNYYLKL